MSLWLLETNLLQHKSVVKYVSEVMETIATTERTLEQFKDNEINVSLVPRGMFRSVYTDVTGMYYDIGENTMEIHFKNGIHPTISGDGDGRNRGVTFLIKQVFSELMRMGEIVPRFSPVTVTISENSSRTEYEVKSSLDQHRNGIPPIEVRNPHDHWSCWGGFTGAIRKEFEDKNIETVLQLVYNRMQQININDVGNNDNLFSALIDTAVVDGFLDVREDLLLGLFIKHGILSLEDSIFGSEDDYLTIYSSEGNRTRVAGRNTRVQIKLNINYRSFSSKLREMAQFADRRQD